MNKDQRLTEQIRRTIPKAEQRARFPQELLEQAKRVDRRVQEQAPEQALPPSPPAKQVEQRSRETKKGKQPEQGLYQHSTHAGTKGKQVQQPLQTVAEVKKPEQPQSRPDSQASLRGRISQQLTIQPSIHKDPKTSEPQPKRQEEYKIQIARIPIEKDALVGTVKVYISLDTAYSNSQTLIFQHFPNVQFYWGGKTPKNAWATRIVRLQKGGKSTPYFLLVNKGGQQKCRPPRNQNANLTDGREPIFGDAFVFKLGDPELHEDSGHARYVDIETDVGRISWLPGSIREAATKIKTAEPADANPGFPDLSKYADSETVKQQASESHIKMNYNIVKSVIKRMTSVIFYYRKDVGILGTDLDPEADKFIKTACVAFEAIRKCADVKSADAVEKDNRRFPVMEKAFFDFLGKIKFANQLRDKSSDLRSQIWKGVEDAFFVLEDEVDRQEDLIQRETAGLD